MIESRCCYTALDKAAHLLHEHLERTLNTIINAGKEPRTKFNSERETGILNRFTGTNPIGSLIDLDDDIVTLDLDDLSHKLFISYTNHIIHVCV